MSNRTLTAVESLITTYHELNPNTITTLRAVPSPLEFLRHVSLNRPFVVRSGASHWAACRLWTAEYLRNVMDDSAVTVAITPSGHADALAPDPASGEVCFLKPLEEVEMFGDFLDYVQRQERGVGGEGREEEEEEEEGVKYAQTQNDNLRGEYAALYGDVEADIPWARIALDREPEAVNLWIGNSRSVTSLHRDNYENVYVQVVGEKQFVLLPPVEVGCVNERRYRQGTYVRTEKGEGKGLKIQLDEDEEMIPVASWDPDSPEENGTVFSRLSQPMRVSLRPGDLLYLPALWYHKVSQTCGEDEICVAVNYWYDMDFQGHLWPTCDFMRNVALEVTEQGPLNGDK